MKNLFLIGLLIMAAGMIEAVIVVYSLPSKGPDFVGSWYTSARIGEGVMAVGGIVSGIAFWIEAGKKK